MVEKKEIIKEIKLFERICPKCNTSVKYHRKNKPKICPTCNDKYYDKPGDEYKLFHLQDAHYAGDKQALGKMYEIIVKYSKVLILKKLKKMNIVLNNEIIEIKAIDTATKFIEYYLKISDFKIDRSFGAYLSDVIKWYLFGDKKEESHESLNFKIDNEKEFGDFVYKIGYESICKTYDDVEEEFIKTNKDVLSEVMGIIEECIFYIKKNSDNPKDVILTLFGINNYLIKKSNFMDKYYDVYGLKIKKNIEKIALLIFKYLKEVSN